MTLMIITLACGAALIITLLYPRKPIVDNTKLRPVSGRPQQSSADK